MHELIELYEEWFTNKDWWFSKNNKNDVYLCDKYYKYIIDVYRICEQYNNFCVIDDNRIIIACIIMLDQIPRHYARVYCDKIDIIEYSKKAVTFSNILLLKNNYNNFSIDELSFIYLPYRHLKDIDKIYEILDIFINLYNNGNSIDKLKCKRYITATLDNIYKDINILSINNTINIKKWDNINKNVLDPNSIISSQYVSQYKDIVYKNMIEQIDNIKDNSTIIISLSGGVDSIVAMHLCKSLQENNCKIKNIIAVHINYNNRILSYDELHFVNYYCNKLNIKLYFRTIKEIGLKSCLHNGLRDLYEEITKKIRYDMYRLNIKNNSTYVLLGHNKDDCFENILTNISNKSNYDNLSGMDIFKEIDGIVIWRPLLNIEKKHIIDYANVNNIPYLYDSTPKWSIRGKIRDNIKPAFLKLKNNDNRDEDSVIDAFFDLKEYISNTQNIFNEVIINNLISKLKFDKLKNEYNAYYNKNELQSLTYKSVCELFFKHLKIKCSNKALGEFSKFISNYKERSFVLNKTCRINIKTNENNYLIIIKI